MDVSGTALDRDALRQNVVANKADARISYRSQANKSVKVIEHKIGDKVLLKRTHGAYPKINSFWVGPYSITNHKKDWTSKLGYN